MCTIHPPTCTPTPTTTVVQELKEEVLAYERLMLHVMGFNLYMDPPDYAGVLMRVKELAYPLGSSSKGSTGNKEAEREEEYNRLSNFAVSALNDMCV